MFPLRRRCKSASSLGPEPDPWAAWRDPRDLRDPRASPSLSSIAVSVVTSSSQEPPGSPGPGPLGDAAPTALHCELRVLEEKVDSLFDVLQHQSELLSSLRAVRGGEGAWVDEGARGRRAAADVVDLMLSQRLQELCTVAPRGGDGGGGGGGVSGAEALLAALRARRPTLDQLVQGVWADFLQSEELKQHVTRAAAAALRAAVSGAAGGGSGAGGGGPLLRPPRAMVRAARAALAEAVRDLEYRSARLVRGAERSAHGLRLALRRHRRTLDAAPAQPVADVVAREVCAWRRRLRAVLCGGGDGGGGGDGPGAGEPLSAVDKLMSRAAAAAAAARGLGSAVRVSADLHTDTQLKCSFLEDTLVNLDPEHPLTRAHLPASLRTMRAALVRHLAAPAAPQPATARRVALIVMAIDSLLRTCQI